MTEEQIGFLYKIASVLPKSPPNENYDLLKSYFLMRCKEKTKGYGLPERHFATKIRCSHCCVEWKKGVESKLTPLKLNSKQRHRIRSKKFKPDAERTGSSQKDILSSNNLEITCSVCKKKTITLVTKPEKCNIVIKSTRNKEVSETEALKTPPMNKINAPAKQLKNPTTNVYSKGKDVFSLKNKNNTLASSIKVKKVIKNNKRKKDKYAGLCQQAVLASAKLKQEKEKTDKLKLFLRPSL